MPFRIIEQLPYKKPIFKINYDNSLLTLSDNSLGLNGFVIKSSTPILKASIMILSCVDVDNTIIGIACKFSFT